MLKVWLPLNDTLDNQGVSSVSFTNNGATVNSSGKIGSCYSFNGSNTSLRSTTSLFTNDTQEFSYACWFKPASTTIGCLFSCRTSTGKTGIAIFVNNSGSIFFDAGGARQSFSYALAANTWYHLAFTYKAGDKKVIYINGIQVDSISSTDSMTTVSTNMFIGASQNKDTAVSGNYLNGLLNDVRIYDHCLSAAEVHEISQGLVLHYKLEETDIQYRSSNLFTSTTCNGGNLASHGSFINNGNGVNINWTSNAGDTYWYFNLSTATLTAGQTYTLQFNCSGLNGKTVTFAWCNKNTHIYQLKEGFNSYTFSAPDVNLTKPFFDDITRDTTLNNLQLWNFQLYDFSNVIVQDSSGYGHNGTINGTLTLSNNTPRYSISSYMPTATTITHEKPIPNNTDQEWTCSMWVKLDTVGQGNIQLNNFNLGNRIVHSANGHALMYLNSGANDYYNYGNLAVTANVWTHIAFVFKNSNATKLIYINGVNHTNTGGPNKTSTPAGIPNTVTVGTNLAGYISDYRVYCTALSAADIKQLYEVGAKVDNLHNIHTFEYSENSSAIKFTKQGQLKEGEIQEDTTTKFYKTDKIIKAKQFIER